MWSTTPMEVVDPSGEHDRGAERARRAPADAPRARSTASCESRFLSGTWSPTRGDKHPNEARSRAARTATSAGSGVEETSIGVDAFMVVDVEQPAAAPDAAPSSCGPAGWIGAPAASQSSDQDFVPLHTCRRARARFLRGTRQGDRRLSRSERLAAPRPGPASAIGIASSNVARARFLTPSASSSMWQPAGRKGKTSLRLPVEVAARTTEEGAKAPIEAELLRWCANEVEHRAQASCPSSTQPTSKLLEEQRRAVRRTQQEQRCRPRGGRCPR